MQANLPMPSLWLKRKEAQKHMRPELSQYQLEPLTFGSKSAKFMRIALLSSFKRK